MTAPERIYLQGAADAPDCEDPNSGVTWCWHQIDDTDVEYVRADIAARATAEQSAPTPQKLDDVSNGQWAEIHKDQAEKTLTQVREILTDSTIPHVAVRVCRALEKIDLILPAPSDAKGKMQ